MTESCSASSTSSCVSGTQSTTYTCTVTGRQYSVSSSCTSGSSSCGTINCPSGMYQCSCSCCGTPTGSGSSNNNNTTTTTTSNGGAGSGCSMSSIQRALCEKQCTLSCIGQSCDPNDCKCC